MDEGSVDAHVAQIEPRSEVDRKIKSLKINALMAGHGTWHRACNDLSRPEKTTQTQIHISP
jgi:hypothetical protein